jgi:Flp pilus assembly protein TadG
MASTTRVGFNKARWINNIQIEVQDMSHQYRGAKLKSVGHQDSGQSLVEFALTLPVLLLVLTGITTFGLAMNNYLSLTEATSVGARQIAISRTQTLDPCAVGSSAVFASAPGFNQQKFNFTFTFNGVNYNGTSCASSSTSTGAAGNLKQGMPATVSITYPCNLVAYNYNFGTCNLQAQTTEVVQ